MIPGSILEVGQAGDRGRAEAIDGSSARVTIDPCLHANEKLDIHQIACTQSGSSQLLPPDPLPLIAPHKLASPYINAPVYACDRAILIAGVVDGADVTLFRNVPPSPTASFTGGFDRDTLWFIPVNSSPFMDGEELSVSQMMRPCEAWSDKSAPVKVLPPQQALPPSVGTPICEGSRTVFVSGLTPGNKVRILQDGQQLLIGEAPSSSFPFNLNTPLPPNVHITAQQERCGIWGEESTPPILVEVAPSQITPPEIALVYGDPLVECSTVVPIKASPGSLVTVFSDKLGPISAPTYINSQEAAIQVQPALLAGDKIFIEQIACGNSRLRSHAVRVISRRKMESPIIAGYGPQGQVEAGQNAIIVTVIAGAIVEVYLNGKLHKTVHSGKWSVVVMLGIVLKVGDRLNARQIFCNQASDINPEKDKVVVRPLPYPPQNLKPDGGKVGRKPTLTWTDLMRGRPASADKFEVEITINGNVSPLQTVTSPSYTFSENLPFSANVTWKVRGKNTSGDSSWSQASFRVEDSPPTPTPTLPPPDLTGNINVVACFWVYGSQPFVNVTGYAKGQVTQPTGTSGNRTFFTTKPETVAASTILHGSYHCITMPVSGIVKGKWDIAVWTDSTSALTCSNVSVPSSNVFGVIADFTLDPPHCR